MKDIETLKYISQNSQHVLIDVAKIRPFLKSIKNWNYYYWLSDNKLNLDEKEYILFAFICESINFCFWGNRKWKVNFEGEEFGGAIASFYSIINEVSSNKNFLNIDYLSKLTIEDFKKIMESNNQLPPLLEERFRLLKETINIIAKKNKNFYKELFSASSDIELLNYILTNFSHFDDKSELDGKIIHFNKRAILLTNDLFHLSETIRKNIKNVDNLTGGADYAIPRLFREYGIFKYSDELLDFIKNEKLIEPGSRMEIEIRSNTLYVFELMREFLKEQKIYLNSVQLDNIIWGTRIQNEKKLPVHHTETFYY